MPIAQSHPYGLNKQKIIVVLLLVILSNSGISVFGQNSEFGVIFGGSYYLGDLNPNKHFALTRIGAGGIFRYNINEHTALRLNGIYASVEGNDAKVKYNEDRNLSFVSNIAEISLQGEANFLRFEPGDMSTPHTPYLFAGLGVFTFNPKGVDMDGRYHELQPLGTEGQGLEEYPDRKPYRRYSSSILFGIGYKFNITRHFTGGLEWGMRNTGTDYLDDVSTTYPNIELLDPTAAFFSDRSLGNNSQNENFQRGNPNNNDWYSFAGFILTFKLPNFRRADCPAFN